MGRAGNDHKSGPSDGCYRVLAKDNRIGLLRELGVPTE